MLTDITKLFAEQELTELWATLSHRLDEQTERVSAGLLLESRNVGDASVFFCYSRHSNAPSTSELKETFVTKSQNRTHAETFFIAEQEVQEAMAVLDELEAALKVR